MAYMSLAAGGRCSTLKLDYVPSGVGPGGVDHNAYSGAWSPTHCKDAAAEGAVFAALPPTRSP